MNLSKLAQQALMDIPDSIEVVSEGKNFADSTPAYFLKSGKGVIAYTLPEPVARFYEALTPQVVIELLASRSALERECERLQAELQTIRDARSYESKALTELCERIENSTGIRRGHDNELGYSESELCFIESAAAELQAELAQSRKRADCLRALLPRVAEAVRSACQRVATDSEEHWSKDKRGSWTVNRMDEAGDLAARISGVDVSAIIKQITGAAER